MGGDDTKGKLLAHLGAGRHHGAVRQPELQTLIQPERRRRLALRPIA